MIFVIDYNNNRYQCDISEKKSKPKIVCLSNLSKKKIPKKVFDCFVKCYKLKLGL